LFKIIKKKTQLEESVVYAIFNEIYEGIYETSMQNITHRDLKAENVLATKDYDIKICDFGLAWEKRKGF